MTAPGSVVSAEALEKKRARSRVWHAANPTYGRDWYRAKRASDPDYGVSRHPKLHGLTSEAYEALLVAQDGVCAICGRPETATQRGRVMRLAIDHDKRHCPGKWSCGECVRGLLCSRCNLALGQLRDDENLVRRALTYLTRRPVDASARALGHPPVAARTVLVDFDATLYPFDELFGFPAPLPGAAEAMRTLRDADYRIVIFTSRLSRVWLENEGLRAEDQIHYIQNLLARDDIPYDDITGDKRPGLVMFDDKAVRVSVDYPLAEAVADFLVGQP